MAVRKPLVIVNGEIQRLQAGDTIDVQPDQISATFTQAATIGQILYQDGGSGSVSKALADAAGTSVPFGMAAATTAAAAAGDVITDGIVTATTGEWDAVTGQTGGLTPGSKYYMSAATAGNITTTPPSATGEYVVALGVANSTTEFLFRPGQRILL